MAQTAADVATLAAATSQLQQATAELHQVAAAQARSAAPARPGEGGLRGCDASIKRNTALIKKIRGLTPDTAPAVLQECENVNQEKFVSEAAGAVAEAVKRPADVAAALQVAGLLHQRYADFSSSLCQQLVKAFGVAAAKGGADDERALAKRRRGVLRLAAEALLAGLLPAKEGLAGLSAMLQELGGSRWEQDGEAFTRAVTLLSLFAKSPVREALLGCAPVAPALPVPTATLAQAEAPEEVKGQEGGDEAWVALCAAWQGWQAAASEAWALPAPDRAPLVKVVDGVYAAACRALVSEHGALKDTEEENARVLNSRGDLPADVAADYQRRRQAYEGLQRALAGLSEVLGRPMPDLPEDTMTRLDGEGGVKQVTVGLLGAGADSTEGPWDDAETAAFYESLPDIKSLVPAMLLGLEKPTKKTAPDGQPPPTPPQAGQEDASDQAPVSAAAAGGPQDDATPSTAASGVGAAADAEPSDPSGPAAPGPRGEADALLQRLPTCVSKDLVDEVCVAWCFHNSKPARKRLIRALCELPRGVGLPLVPFYARAVAIFAQAFPDVPAGVISHLEAEFAALLSKKDSTQVTLEPRLRNARYLAELCKFRMYPPGSLFLSLKALLDDFSGLNVDAGVALVEAAGRYLLRNPETATRMDNMLEVMGRVKNARNLDARQAALVDGAVAGVRAPRGGFNAARAKKRPPLQAYIRRLIHEELSTDTLPDVLRRLLRLPWADCERYVLKCMMKVVRGRASNMPLVVSLAYGLNKYYESLGVAMVDGVLEAVREGLEAPGRGTYQKRVADARLLGELYNYCLCDSSPVFEALYLLVTFAHEAPQTVAAPAALLDPPSDYFRIRLVLALLEVCGQYFRKGRAGARLDRFLTFFQAYVLSKAHPLPLDVEFDLEDVLHTLRPNLHRFTSMAEAAEAVGAILSAEAAAGGGGALGIIEEEGSEDEDERGPPGPPSSHDISARDSDADPGSGLEDNTINEDAGSDTEAADEDFERELAALTGAGPAAPPAPRAPTATDQPASGSAAVVTVRLLMKRGGRDDRSRELQVPGDTRIAAAVSARQAEEAQERRQLKALVLAANRQQEDEQSKASRGAGGRGGGRGKQHSRTNYVPTSL